MIKLWIPLALAGVLGACSDTSGVDPDAIPGPELLAVRTALDSAFLHDTTLDPAFTGDSGLYALMSTLVFFFIDRASRIGQGTDTTRVVGIEFDIDATQNGTRVISNFTTLLAWKGYDSTTSTVDSVLFLLGSGRAPVNDSLRPRFTLDSASTGTGFVIHEARNSAVTKWWSRGGHLRTTASQYGTAHGTASFSVARGSLSGAFTINAKFVPDSSTAVTSALDFGNGARAIKVKIRGTLPSPAPMR
ncbi:MAG: hypothetical protein DMD38_02235 [Gemmatimonadetes bacterium]|nr:MAG: hypothetical protein AUI09_01340 [Gemmatimonadetes bacterium 13_2_20CM_2_66_5]PYP98225.1 MAG: hypothetical protein DMD38_02235 [Gemmatimonadota bacterium]